MRIITDPISKDISNVKLTRQMLHLIHGVHPTVSHDEGMWEWKEVQRRRRR
jgi:hypothetical protein